MTSRTFFEFLRFAMAPQGDAPRSYSPQEWEALFKLARMHSLVGVSFAAADAVPRKVGPSLGLYTNWAMKEEKVRAANAHHLEVAADVAREFAAAGFRSCVLKGQGSGAYYPQPLRRQCGDIDIWVDGTRDEVLAYLKDYRFGEIVYHHCDPKGLRDVSVEVHFTPSWMNDPLLNSRLQKWFRSQADRQFANAAQGLGFCTPTADFAAVFALVHIFRHVMDEGIGLRQLMDLYYILKAVDPELKAGISATLRSIGLGRFSCAVMYVLGEAFALPEEYMIAPPDKAHGSFLLGEVARAGNFGKHDARNAHGRNESRLAKTRRKTLRQLRFFSLCPREVLAAPFFKLWQYCWRKRKKYL